MYGTMVQEQECNWQKSRVKWDLSRLVDVSQEQALFNGVVISVPKKKLWHIGLRNLRFMYESARNRKSCGFFRYRYRETSDDFWTTL